MIRPCGDAEIQTVIFMLKECLTTPHPAHLSFMTKDPSVILQSLEPPVSGKAMEKKNPCWDVLILLPPLCQLQSRTLLIF